LALFVSAGRADWPMGWGFIAIVAATHLSIAVVLTIRNPGLMRERAQIKGTRDLDRVLASIMALYGPVGICIVAGLNVHFAWLPTIPLGVRVGGIIIALLGSALTTWAVASNRFFYGVLRIAPQEGQTPCTVGPYQYVRHPGYLGMILGDLAIPLILGSVWAFIPAVLAVCAIVIRTGSEDRALQNGLDGYVDYGRNVRHRLVPGLW
jgi:protein-S-isoprenylcysteine O-methyltransferase Ste14